MTEQHHNDIPQMDTSARLGILESQYKVVERHTTTVSKLSTKVTLLLTIMTFAAVIATGGVVYTFTGINDFKDSYHIDKIDFQKQILTGIGNLGSLMDAKMESIEDKMDDKMEGIEDKMDDKMDSIEDKFDERMDELEKKVLLMEKK